MGESTGIVKSIINLLKPKSKPELSDIEYESIIEHLSSKEHLLNEGATDEGSLIKISDEFVEVDVRHSSVVAFGQQPGNLQQPYVQQAGPSRAVNQ